MARPEKETNASCNEYRALVVDSGPIIRLTGLTALRDKAASYYTVPAVMQEIRDARARQHLEQLPFELQTREASAEGIQAVVHFSRLTGDYQSLSAVDLQVLGLLWDLEREGCHGDMDHVRTTPKRTVGLGKIEALAKEESKEEPLDEKGAQVEKHETGEDFFERGAPKQPQDETIKEEAEEQPPPRTTTVAPKSWAALVNPEASAPPRKPESVESERNASEQAVLHTVTFASMKLSEHNEQELGGQFSDADEDDSSSDDSYANKDGEDISDEECDVYVLEPDEVEARKRASGNDNAPSLNAELESDFPSLAASRQVPYEGSDDENDQTDGSVITPALRSKQIAEQKMQEALKPVTKSGKLYNSFRNYKDLMKPKPTTKASKEVTDVHEDLKHVSEDENKEEKQQASEAKDGRSRIIGGMTMAGQGTEVEDDGEGWIMSSADIQTMKAAGRLNPSQNPADLDRNANSRQETGPPICQRAACTTTDFAMQNVILQMNLELLSVDGIKIRRLKSWVTRCGACFTVFADGENVGPNNTKRLFCGRCGSDMLQRVAASVDGKTGRLRLHLSKKYKASLRGTKFSLPKPGTGNRFQGDLLLREDQLLMGAWNQKVKQQSGGKARKSATSMFGTDLASTVGCNASTIKSDDIKVGFGRRNPNATKHGRERRGKKKKSSDKACGLRRY